MIKKQYFLPLISLCLLVAQDSACVENLKRKRTYAETTEENAQHGYAADLDNDDTPPTPASRPTAPAHRAFPFLFIRGPQEATGPCPGAPKRPRTVRTPQGNREGRELFPANQDNDDDSDAADELAQLNINQRQQHQTE